MPLIVKVIHTEVSTYEVPEHFEHLDEFDLMDLAEEAYNNGELPTYTEDLTFNVESID